MTNVKRLSKRVGAFLTAFLIVSFIVLYNGAVAKNAVPVKADILSVLGSIITTIVDSTGEAATMETDPVVALAISAAAVSCGMKFNSKGQQEDFIKGFWIWMFKAHGVDVKSFVSEAKKEIGAYGIFLDARVQVQLLPLAITYIRQYILNLKSPDVSTTPITVSGSFTSSDDLTVSRPEAGSNTTTKDSYKTLDANTIYTISLNDMKSNLIGQKEGDIGSDIINAVYVDSSGKKNLYTLAAAQPNSSNIYQQYMGSTITTTSDSISIHIYGANNYQYGTFVLSNITFPYDLQIQHYVYDGTSGGSSSWVNINAALNCTESGTGILGDSTAVNDTASSQNPALANTDAGVTVSVPITGADSIPSSTVVGQTAATVSTAVSAADATITATPTATTTTPDWTKPGTKAIDWSPLMNLKVFDKFPFCLPWDLKNIVTALVATPVAPDFQFSIPMSALHLPNFDFEVKFSDYETPIAVIRWGILLTVTGGLIFSMYKLIKH